MLGASVHGVSNGVPSEPNNFDCCTLKDLINHNFLDVLDFEGLKKLLQTYSQTLSFI